MPTQTWKQIHLWMSYPHHNGHNFLCISVMKYDCNENTVNIIAHTNSLFTHINI